MLQCKGLCVYYDRVRVIADMSFDVKQGEIVALIGANGAGKSTTLKTISGLVRPAKGSVQFGDVDITRKSPERIVKMGVTHVPEGRRVFPGMTVVENLEMGACSWRSSPGQKLDDDLDRVFSLFPVLKERRRQSGWSLSGGEQQMLAIGRGLMARPKLLLLDEPSLGLAPIIIENLFATIKEINKQGVTILLVEQNAFMALEICDRGHVLETGDIVLSGTGEALAKNEQVKKAYLGG